MAQLSTLGIVRAYEDFHMAFDFGVGSGVFYLLGDVWPDYEVTRRYRTRVAGFARHHGLFVPSESLDFVLSCALDYLLVGAVVAA